MKKLCSKVTLSRWYLGITSLILVLFIAPSSGSAAVVAIVIFAIQLIGMAISSHLEGEFNSFSRTAIGFLAAVLITTETNQIFLHNFERGVPWWSIAIVAVILKTFYRSQSVTTNLQEEASSNFLLILVFSTLGVAAFTYYWISPIAVIFGTVICLRMTDPHKSATWIGSGLFVISLLVVAFMIKPRYWLLIQEEQIFYGALSSSLANLPASSSLLAASSGIEYHWLTYGLTGWLSREAQMDQIPIMSWLLPILFALLALGLCLSIFRVYSLRLTRQFAIATSLILFHNRMGLGSGAKVLNVFITAAPTASLAYSAALILLVSRSSRANTAYMSLAFLLAYGAVGSYTTTAIAPLLGVVSSLGLVILFRFRQARKRKSLLACAAIIAGSAFALLRFTGFPFGEAYDGARIGVFPFLGFVESQSTEIFSLVGSWRLLAKIGYFAGLCAPQALALLVLLRKRPPSLTLALTAIMAFGALGIAVTQTDSFANHLPILTGTYLFAVPILAHSYVTNFQCRPSSYMAPLLALFTWTLWYQLDLLTRHSGSSFSIGFRYGAMAVPALLGLVTATIPIYSHSSQGRGLSGPGSRTMNFHQRIQHAVGAVLVFAGLHGSYSLVESYNYYNHRYEVRGATLAPSSETVSASNWMRTNSSRESLYAVDNANSDIELQNLIRLSGRQVLTIGPELWALDFRRQERGPQLLQLQRLLSEPNEGLLRRLRNENVTHVILRRDISQLRFSAMFGPPRFQNSRWSIYIMEEITQ